MIGGALQRGVTGELAPALARFGSTLRAHGIAATVRDEIDAVQALGLIDRDDRDEVKTALRIALKIRARPGPRTTACSLRSGPAPI